MAIASVTWQDVRGLARFANGFAAIGEGKFKIVAARAVNRTGDMARTQVIRTLTTQTGLKRRVIVRAIKVVRARQDGALGDIAYQMSARGGDIALKHFSARETRRGVSATPFGKRTIFAGTFLKAGAFPVRISVAKFNGHVFRRTGSGRLPIEKVKSGVIIPVEMVKGETLLAFRRSVETNLPRRVEHELYRMLKV